MLGRGPQVELVSEPARGRLLASVNPPYWDAYSGGVVDDIVRASSAGAGPAVPDREE